MNNELSISTLKALDELMKLYHGDGLNLDNRVRRALLKLIEDESKIYAKFTNAKMLDDQLIIEANKAIKDNPQMSNREIVEILKQTSKLGCGEPLYFAGRDDDAGLTLVALLRINKLLIEE